MNLNKILSAITKTKLNGCVLFCCRPLLLTLCVHGHWRQLAAGCHHSADPVTATPSATLTLHDSQVDVPTKKGWRGTVGHPWCGPFYRKVTYQRIEGKTRSPEPYSEGIWWFVVLVHLQGKVKKDFCFGTSLFQGLHLTIWETMTDVLESASL